MLFEQVSEKDLLVEKSVSLFIFYLHPILLREGGSTAIDPVVNETELPTISETAFFSYRNKDDELKNRIIAALKQRDAHRGGIVRQSTIAYGLPLWDDYQRATIDSATRLLVPLVDTAAKKLLGIWAFDYREGCDTVRFGIGSAPVAIADTSNGHILYDYFRFKLGYPDGCRLKFEEELPAPDLQESGIRPCGLVVRQVCHTINVYWYFGPVDRSGNPLNNTDWRFFYSYESCEEVFDYEWTNYFTDEDRLPLDIGGGRKEPEVPRGEKPAVVQYTVTLAGNPFRAGLLLGVGVFDEGTLCTISASANAGYVFKGWTGSAVSTAATYRFTLTDNMHFTATFVLKDSDCGLAVQAQNDKAFNDTLSEYRKKAPDPNGLEYGYSRRANGSMAYPIRNEVG